MLTVHKMQRKNQFLTGISSGYDKTPNQKEPQPFNRHYFAEDCTIDFLGKESCHRVTSTITGTGILLNTSKMQDVELMFFTGDFDTTGRRNANFVYETSKSDNFIVIFTSYRKPYDETANIKLTA